MLKNNLDRSQELIEAVLPQWQQVTPTPLTIELLQTFFNKDRVLQIDTLESWLLNDLADRSELPAAFNRQSMLSMLNPPDASGLIEVLKPFAEYMATPTYRDELYWYCFKIIDGKKVERIQAKIDQLESDFVFIVENDEEGDRLKLVQKVLDALKAIQSRCSIPGHALTVEGLVSTDIEGTLQASPTFVKTGNIATRAMFASVRKVEDLKSTLPQPAKAMVFPDDTPPEVITAANMAAQRNANHRPDGITI